MNRNFKRKTFYNILSYVILCILIFSSIMLIKELKASNDNKTLYIDIKNNINAVDVTKTEDYIPSNKKYESLYQSNKDFVGWIKIENTNIDYPVVQSLTVPNFYLEHDFNKSESIYGTPYIDAECDMNTSNNFIIYGHHMKNGTMFNNIIKYKDQEFYNEHKEINFDTMNGYGEYEVISAFRIDIDNDNFLYHQYNNMNEDKFAEFINEIKLRSLIDTEVNTKYGDKLITLSTCEYTYKNGRFVVVAKKIK